MGSNAWVKVGFITRKKYCRKYYSAAAVNTHAVNPTAATVGAAVNTTTEYFRMFITVFTAV